MSALEPILNWLAPAATIIAAMMTAANLGSRITGWGFAIFFIASLCWTALGISTGQSSLVYANSFLVFVNAIGVWRWLGRQAGYEKGADIAAKQSAREKVASLFSFAGLIGVDIFDDKGEKLGTVVDVMGNCSDRAIAYIVVSEGGLVGVGEKLHAVRASALNLDGDNPVLSSGIAHLQNLPELKPGSWPIKV